MSRSLTINKTFFSYVGKEIIDLYRSWRRMQEGAIPLLAKWTTCFPLLNLPFAFSIPWEKWEYRARWHV